MTRAEKRQEWEARIAEYKSSGQSVREWCAANGVKPDRLWYRLRQEKAGKAGSVASTTWLQATVTGPTPGEQDRAGLLVRIGETSIEVRAGFDPELLSGVVRVLSTIC